MPTSGAKGHTNQKRNGFSLFQVGLLILFSLALQQTILREPPSLNVENYAQATSGTILQELRDNNPLMIPIGKAQNLPSIRVKEAEEDNEKIDRKIYGGKGDKKHLGGFTEIDMNGISPALWKHVVQNWTVQSVIDVGCGRGISTSWFVTHGLRTECAEGSHDAIEQSMVPDKSILTEHDFSRGPWWPEKTFDAVWSVEFLEHVGLQYQYNYVSVFRKAAILMVSHSNWGGWHHVEVHQDEWWIQKYESYGFRFSQELTKEVRMVAQRSKERSEEAVKNNITDDGDLIFPPNGEPYNGQHLWTSMLIFINPMVASLPQHAHLFGTPGCYGGKWGVHRECGEKGGGGWDQYHTESKRDPSYFPLVLTKEQDQKWFDIVKANIDPNQAKLVNS